MFAGARKSLDAAVGISASTDENTPEIEFAVLSPYDKRKKGIKTSPKIRLTPRPKNTTLRKEARSSTKLKKSPPLKENVVSLGHGKCQYSPRVSPSTKISPKVNRERKQEKIVAKTKTLSPRIKRNSPKNLGKKQNTGKRKSIQNDADFMNAPAEFRSEDAKNTPQKKRTTASGKRPKKKDSSPSSNSLSSGVEEIWQPPLLEAAATYQLASKYKELDTFDNIFDDSEETDKSDPIDQCEPPVGTSTSVLDEAMKAMREITEKNGSDTSDLASSPQSLISPGLQGFSEVCSISIKI